MLEHDLITTLSDASLTADCEICPGHLYTRWVYIEKNKMREDKMIVSGNVSTAGNGTGLLRLTYQVGTIWADLGPLFFITVVNASRVADDVPPGNVMQRPIKVVRCQSVGLHIPHHFHRVLEHCFSFLFIPLCHP